MRKFHLLSLATVFALLAAGLSACFVPVPPVAVTYTPTPVPNQDWEAIQQRGTIVVGTSADYPPLSFYDDTFRITGFEPELMRALGERMGVEVQFRDTPFPGLPNALQQRQVDALISAISITPEREAAMDFTDVYLIGEDAFLVAAGTELGGINTLDEVQRDTRVGVQEGSSYQAWLEQELVEPGLLPAANLLTYADAERAVRDLRSGRVDVVVMDALPAQEFVNQGGIEIAAQGLNRQRYAIGVRTGSDDLRRALNAALDELRRDGTLGQLLTQYLGVEPQEVLPSPTVETAATVTPTPSPTATRAPSTFTPQPPPSTRTPTATPVPARCVDGMAWERDLTFDDKNMTAPPVLSPGQVFVKGWRVRNTGTCTWDNRYRLAYVGGNTPAAQMGGIPVFVAGTVPPGATYDFYVQLVAPAAPGTYQGFWQMYNDLNRPFGARVWVGIRVPSPVTATPTPTPTSPAAQIEFHATPNNITDGDPVNFWWNVQNVREVYFYREGQNWWEHGVEGVGSRTEYPSSTTSYFLRVVLRDGSVEVREERIYVEQEADPPDIRFFNVEPDDRIVLGQCVDISWDVRNVDDVDITRNGDSVWRNAPDQGDTRDCPPGLGRFEYRLDASGPGGNSRARRSVEVVAGATATPTPSPTPTPTSTQVPVSISLFNVVPAQIELGQCLSISWAVIGDPILIQIKRSGTVILDNAAYSGSMQDCPTAANTYVYRIEATQRNGTLGDAREVTAVVAAGATATPTSTPTTTPTPTETTAPPPPTINAFTLSVDQIVLGECVTLAWDFTGEAAAGNIARTSSLSETVILLTDPAPVGDYPDCPPAADTYTYRLKVGSEFGGTAETVRTLIVAPPAP